MVIIYVFTKKAKYLKNFNVLVPLKFPTIQNQIKYVFVGVVAHADNRSRREFEANKKSLYSNRSKESLTLEPNDIYL